MIKAFKIMERQQDGERTTKGTDPRVGHSPSGVMKLTSLDNIYTNIEAVA